MTGVGLSRERYSDAEGQRRCGIRRALGQGGVAEGENQRFVSFPAKQRSESRLNGLGGWSCVEKKL